MKFIPALLAACLVSTACLENEEDIEIRPDGSARVSLKTSGDVEDLTAGYALPLHDPWRPIDPVTHTWIQTFGGATGGSAVRGRFRAGAWSEMGDPSDPGVALAVQAEFTSVSDIPMFLAPPDETYRSAFLQRDSRLTITAKGTRQVYVFERTYGSRPFWNRFDQEHVPAEVIEALQEKRRLTDDQVRQFADSLRTWAHTAPSMHIVTSALGAVYMDGDGSLSTAAYQRAVTRLHAVIDRTIVPETVAGLFDRISDGKQAGAELPPEFDLERQLRDGARTVIAEALEGEGIAPEVRHAVLERLEWNFTSYDHAQDIADEKFKLNVTMPGTIVDGNFDELDGNTARWTFEGTQLHGASRDLRVVSVLE